MGQVVVRQADDGADGKAEGGKAAAAGAAGAEVAEGAEGGGGGGREDGGGDGSGAASAATEALLPGFAAAVKRSYTGQLLQVGRVWMARAHEMSCCAQGCSTSRHSGVPVVGRGCQE